MINNLKTQLRIHFLWSRSIFLTPILLALVFNKINDSDLPIFFGLFLTSGGIIRLIYRNNIKEDIKSVKVDELPNTSIIKRISSSVGRFWHFFFSRNIIPLYLEAFFILILFVLYQMTVIEINMFVLWMGLGEGFLPFTIKDTDTIGLFVKGAKQKSN